MEPESPSRRTLRILLVENDAGMRRYMRTCLSPLDARVIEVDDGREALAMLREADAPIDLVLTDVLMPGLDGLELARRIETDPALAQLPVLFVTGDPNAAVQSGRPVLRKPFSGSLLRTYVEELLR